MARKILTPLDMSSLEVRNMLMHVIAGAPGSPVEGQLWYDSTAKTLSFRTNTASIAIGRLDQISAPTAAVALNAQKITGLGNATVGTDAMNLTTTLAQRLDQFAAPTADVPWNSHKITGLLDPTGAQDAATKNYVDSLINGLDWKNSVRAATTANITTLAGGAPNTLDGVSLAANDRILVKDQTTASQNGIYTVTTLGTGANGTWTRAADADSSAEVTPGMAVAVEEGTASADVTYVLTTNAPIVLATTSLVFSRAFVAPSAGAQKFTALIGDGSTTAIAVTHSLGSQAVLAQVVDATSNAQVECDVVNTSTTVTTFTFAVAPTTNQYRVIIVG